MSSDRLLGALDALAQDFAAQSAQNQSSALAPKREDFCASQPVLGVWALGESESKGFLEHSHLPDGSQIRGSGIARRILISDFAQRPNAQTQFGRNGYTLHVEREKERLDKDKDKDKDSKESSNLFIYYKSLIATPAFFSAVSECRWHLERGERVAREFCAGCRRPIGKAEALDLADDNRVHADPDWRCLIAWGEQWRGAARATRSLTCSTDDEPIARRRRRILVQEIVPGNDGAGRIQDDPGRFLDPQAERPQ